MNVCEGIVCCCCNCPPNVGGGGATSDAWFNCCSEVIEETLTGRTEVNGTDDDSGAPVNM